MEFKIDDLTVVYGNQKSYYGKAKVIYTHDNRVVLRSYDTNVASFHIDTQKLYINGYFSNTTSKHQWDFMKQLHKDFEEVYNNICDNEGFKSFKAFLEHTTVIDYQNKTYKAHHH